MERKISVLILYNDRNEVLLQHRAKDALKSPDHWAFFGGGLEGEETLEEALKREMFEELEYQVKSPHFLLEREGLFVYLERCDESQKLVQHEGQGMSWWKIKDTDNLLMSEKDHSILIEIEEYLNAR